MPDYPQSACWMIEVRNWPDDEEPTAPVGSTEVPEWKRYAPVEPEGFGSGVVIQLEQLDDNDRPFPSARIRNYLLTCGHVVRIGDDGFGPLAKEIICWNPAYGYIRTRRGNRNTNEGRLKRKMEGSHLATVSTLSPYEGRATAITGDEQEPHLDWVLLEVQDLEDRPSFNITPFAASVERPSADDSTYIVGYPSGAGWEKNRARWMTGSRYWGDGHPVHPTTSGDEEIDKVENHIITYNEEVEARPGMSGGGVFRKEDHVLVGLHRSRDDLALNAQALCVEDILEWLRTHRHVRPVFPLKKSNRIPPKWYMGAAAVGALALIAWLWPKTDKPVDPPPTQKVYVWRGFVQERVIEGGTVQKKPVDGAIVMPHLNNADVTELQVTTPSPGELGPGEFEIRTANRAYTGGATKLKISKEGYEPIDPDAQAVTPLQNDLHRRIYILTKKPEP